MGDPYDHEQPDLPVQQPQEPIQHRRRTLLLARQHAAAYGRATARRDLAVTDVDEKFGGLPAHTRATELPDPPTNHYFLKIFGQPQREMACQCERSTESNLSQALQMINGPTVHGKLRDDNGRIAHLIKENKSDDEIITELYLTALSRRPMPEELKASKKHIANSADRRQGLEDVGWAILNSKEFLFQH